MQTRSRERDYPPKQEPRRVVVMQSLATSAYGEGVGTAFAAPAGSAADRIGLPTRSHRLRHRHALGHLRSHGAYLEKPHHAGKSGPRSLRGKLNTSKNYTLEIVKEANKDYKQ